VIHSFDRSRGLSIDAFGSVMFAMRKSLLVNQSSNIPVSRPCTSTAYHWLLLRLSMANVIRCRVRAPHSATFSVITG